MKPKKDDENLNPDLEAEKALSEAVIKEAEEKALLLEIVEACLLLDSGVSRTTSALRSKAVHWLKRYHTERYEDLYGGKRARAKRSA